MRSLLILAILLAFGCSKETPPQPCPVCPEAKKELNVREVLELAEVGAAANHIYYVRIPEPSRRTVPNGLDLSVDAYRKTCGTLPMD